MKNSAVSSARRTSRRNKLGSNDAMHSRRPGGSISATELVVGGDGCSSETGRHGRQRPEHLQQIHEANSQNRMRDCRAPRLARGSQTLYVADIGKSLRLSQELLIKRGRAEFLVS